MVFSRHLRLFRVVSTFVTLAAAAGPAAAEPAPKSPPGRAVAAMFQPTQAFEWSGVYAGAQLGYGLGRDRWTLGPVAETFAPRGALGGAHIGYNWRKYGLLLGVEADAEFGAQRGETRYRLADVTGVSTAVLRSEPSWRGSLRFRAGYARGASVAYFTGGVAAARVPRWGLLDVSLGRYDLAFEAEHAPTQAGWTLGLGLEHAFTPDWTARAEYRYADFGVATWRAVDPDARHRLTDHVLRVGVSRYFRTIGGGFAY